jgi:hypothetical protein
LTTPKHRQDKPDGTPPAAGPGWQLKHQEFLEAE